AACSAPAEHVRAERRCGDAEEGLSHTSRRQRMAKSRAAESLRAEEFRVSPGDRPGWTRGSDRTPEVGQAVYCAGGAGAVGSAHGKTGDGSRLLQIRLEDEAARPFFAAASNVLVEPARRRR